MRGLSFSRWQPCKWTSFRWRCVLEMLLVEALLVRGLFLSPSGSRVNVSPLRGDVCWISRQRSDAAGSQWMVQLWWVPLQLAAVWVPLERHGISVHGAVVLWRMSRWIPTAVLGAEEFFPWKNSGRERVRHKVQPRHWQCGITLQKSMCSCLNHVVFKRIWWSPLCSPSDDP